MRILIKGCPSFPWALIFLLLALPTGCGKTEPKALPVIRVGHALHDHHSPLFIAAMNPDLNADGIHLVETVFRKEYLLSRGSEPIAKVTLDSGTGGEELIRKLAEDQLDMAFGGVPAMIKYMDKSDSLRITAPIMSHGNALIIRPSLLARSWEQFVELARSREKPLRIGYKMSFSVQNLLFEEAIRREGIPFSHEPDGSAKVLLTNLHGEKNFIPALEQDLVDGIVANQPTASLAEHKGVGRILVMLDELAPYGKETALPCCALAASSTFLTNSPKAVAAFSALIRRANLYLLDHPVEAAPLVAKWLELPPEVETRSLPTIHFYKSINEQWNRGIKAWLELMVKNEQITGRVKAAFLKGEQDQILYIREISPGTSSER